MRRQLYGDEDDRKFFQWVQSQLKQTEKRLEDGRAVLHHLEAQLINVACDDPGAAIGAQLALPLLQERLDAKAQDFARQKAAQAEEDIIKMEVSQLGMRVVCEVKGQQKQSISMMCSPQIYDPNVQYQRTHQYFMTSRGA